MTDRTNPLFDKLNQTQANYPADQPLHALISAQAQQTPDRIVFASGNETLTYAQLDQRSNQLAHYLNSQGVGPGHLVGLCCSRNLDTAILLVGILKSGAGYVPLDPDYPLDRLQYMVQDSGAKCVLAHQSLGALVESFPTNVIYWESIQSELEQQPSSLPGIELDTATTIAYVIYTSGTTGKPKGVMVPHRCVVNFLWGMKSRGEFGAEDVMLGLTTLSFDISITEIFLPMITGGRTAIVDRTTAKDGSLLSAAIALHSPTLIQATPSTYRFLIDAGWQGQKGANYRLASGGEPLPRDLVQPLLDRCDSLWNWYGPTETTVWSTRFEVTDPQARVLIGTPWENTQVYIVDDQNQLVAPGEEGELLIGGDGVTLGYLNRESLTAEKFIQFQGQRVYRTGDLAKLTADGLLECLGRIDSQVKLHGHRIELEEIEARLAALPHVRQAVATVREDVPGDKRLVAYVIPGEDAAERDQLDLAALRRQLESQLPDYMVPGVIVAAEQFPKTPSGKLDRKALPRPQQARPDLCPYVAPQDKRQQQLANLWADLLQLDRVGIHDNFFQVGGNSILALRTIAQMKELHEIALTTPEFFDNPTISQLTQYIDQQQTSADSATANSTDAASNRSTSSSASENEFAIIGMAARFPGADDVRQYWQNLCEGRESIRRFSPEELDPSLDPQQTQDPSYVPARGIVDGADEFDPQFFGVTPREAELIDPQQRIMLQVAWAAFEDAGCIPEQYSGKIGVWAGSYTNTYFTKNILSNPELTELTGEFQMGVYNEKDYIATRLAHKLNLTGPAINVNTACSTSLVAVIEACNSLSCGHCDVALAGGSSITFPQNSGHVHQTGSIMTPDGHCRPFDSKSAGTMFSDGVGAVVLKRLSDAQRDGDRIYAVVKGTGVNNDGGQKASFTAPSIQGQAEAISMAHVAADIPAESIGYVEAHGTATPIGDPIEVQALTSVFRKGTANKQFCALGSVKGNIGHTVAAAGVAGLIKSTLALYHQQIPPTLHYDQPNPQIDFAASPFFVNAQLQPWSRTETPRRAGVSSFGVGGTNAHVVLEEAPASPTSADPQTNGSRIPVQIVPISAKTTESQQRARQAIAEHLSAGGNSFADVAYTLQTARAEFDHRCFALGSTAEQAAERLTAARLPNFGQARHDGRRREIAFMFPGQGAQYVWMGKNLYDHSPVFRAAMDECCQILTPLLGRDLRDVLYPSDGDESAAAEILRATQFTQPAIFSIGYSLAKLWESWGLQPACLIGHSIGEFVAACLAGVFRLEDGLRMIAERGRLMQSLPGGSMLSIRAAASEIEPRLKGQLALASHNGPKLCVVAGPDDEVEHLRQQLDAEDIVCKPLHTSHAFHSPMMAPIVQPFAEFVAKIPLSPPQKPIMSTVTAEWMTDEQATDPAYWAQHMRAAVSFSPAVTNLWKQHPDHVLLELGPRRTLATLARQHAVDKQQQHALASLSDTVTDNAEWYAMLNSLGSLWLLGCEIDWSALHTDRQPTLQSLPNYCFQQKRCYVQPRRQVTASAPQTAAAPVSACDAPAPIGATQLNQAPPVPVPAVPQTQETQVTATRREQIALTVEEILENTSGVDLADFEDAMTFFEMGMDSLVLTQTAASMKKQLGINITFRQMLEELPTVSALVDYLDRELPADQFVDQVETIEVPAATAAAPQVAPTTAQPQTASLATTDVPAGNSVAPPADGTTHALIQQQLQVMQWQLQVLSGSQPNGPAPATGTPQASASSAAATSPQPVQTSSTGSAEPKSEQPKPTDAEAGSKKAFGAAARVTTGQEDLTPQQKTALDNFITQYVARTPKSKQHAQQHRRYLADPRTVSGFRPSLKEMTYPIVAERSKGAYIWDIDGNKYIDVTCGFGSNFLGHTIDFMVDAMTEQLKIGYEIGPQTTLAGDVAELFCELTRTERCAFANTGSEAVLGATRLARTATGRDLVVMFTGDYHGILDEVIVRGGKRGSFPAATGIPTEHVSNTLILEYGTEESLQTIRENLDQIAAIVVETVQSRRPEFQPQEFLQKLREMTEHEETALVFDEVITGFRIAAGGAQEHFGIQADLSTYGKIVGGGMPIGMIAGKAKYMDGLDGGFWQFGDDSQPEAGMTYFAGTFVRHPVTMAAAKRILQYIKDNKDEIYDRINNLTNRLAREVNQVFEQHAAPLFFANFGSLFKVQVTEDVPYAELFFASLRSRGVHIWDHRPCLLTLAHTDADVDQIVTAFRDSVLDMQANGFLPSSADAPASSASNSTAVTVNAKDCLSPNNGATQPSPASQTQVCRKNARLGKDKDGNPAWFVPDAEHPGQFIQVPPPSER